MTDRISIVPALVDPQAPTVAELEDGVDLTPLLLRFVPSAPPCDHPVTYTDTLTLWRRGKVVATTAHEVTVCLECREIVGAELPPGPVEGAGG